MTNGEALAEWLKWITGGIIAGMVLFWQWMERKVDRLSDRIDKVRDDTRKDRHDLAGAMQRHIDDIDDELKKHSERITRVEKNGK